MSRLAFHGRAISLEFIDKKAAAHLGIMLSWIGRQVKTCLMRVPDERTARLPPSAGRQKGAAQKQNY
jgi:hypothetical protein